jgi:hypothetical protein
MALRTKNIQENSKLLSRFSGLKFFVPEETKSNGLCNMKMQLKTFFFGKAIIFAPMDGRKYEAIPQNGDFRWNSVRVFKSFETKFVSLYVSFFKRGGIV